MDIAKIAKDKLIIVADDDAQSVKRITDLLSAFGFSNIKYAQDGSKIYEYLRPFHKHPEKLGLMIINEDLPQCDIKEMCRNLYNNDADLVLPIIILLHDSHADIYLAHFNVASNHLIHALANNCSDAELKLLISLFLQLHQGNAFRGEQQKKLNDEVADRNIIEAKLKYHVEHDELTGLLNRSKFEHHVKLILNRDPNLPQQGHLLFIDIDRFGLLNELEGYENGDRLIVEVVAIIRQAILTDCLFTRIGSDEFCVYLENNTLQQTKEIASKIRKQVNNYRFASGVNNYHITISIGIASMQSGKAITHPSDLIARGHHACAQAKQDGRNVIRVYDEKDDHIRERHRDLYWVPVIKDALRENRFYLVFQPIVDLRTAQISHFEVLLRMKDHTGDIKNPREFIPVAERMGLIHSIDQWVVEKSIDFVAGLPKNLLHVNLFINLSSIAFQDDYLLPTIKQKLNLTWVDAHRINFEITETAAIANFEKARDMILKIRSLGCKFALDDFGTGFCSFNYLKRFPVDFIKIDGQFIQNLAYDETDRVLVKSMCEIATKLGKKTIAEYVENPQIIDLLKNIGVNMGQGFYYGRPEPKIISHNAVIKGLGLEK